jgi:hypothetical protein
VAVLVGAVVGALWLSAFQSVDLAAWLFAVLVPFAVVVSDWTTPR